MKYIIGLLFVAVLFFSCDKINVYERSVPFPSHNWKSAETPSFSFDIEDTTAMYNIFLVLRHEDAYNYSNIWVKMKVKGPSDSFEIRKEFLLADNTKGWLGSGMDDIFEHRIPFNESATPLQKGKYIFTLKQDMREDPLRHILQAGVRVEKVK